MLRYSFITLFCFLAFATARAQTAYTPQQALIDISAERLKFMGRDYTDPTFPGGNLYCIFKNSRVYVVHNGCRPTPTQSLTVFDAYVFSRSGARVRIYLEDSKNKYDLNMAGPGFPGTWKIESLGMAPIGELTFRQAMDLYVASGSDFRQLCFIKDESGVNCRGPQQFGTEALEDFWYSPHQHGIKQLHDAIINAPRS